MSTAADVMTVVKVGAEVLPDIVEWISDLVSAGHSPEGAQEIVRRDIKSRRAQYQAAKAEDMAALDAKWGGGGTALPPNPFPDGTDAALRGHKVDLDGAMVVDRETPVPEPS